MARNIPVRICILRHSPSNEPKFHQDEIFDGEGKSIRALLAIFITG
jgi:hypothetical protein